MSGADPVGRTETAEDHVSPASAHRMAATLGVAAPSAVLPPLWHWMLFQHWVPPEKAGADGHPRRGGFLPALPDLPRRMWAGGRVAFHAPLALGAAVTRTSTILSVTEKQGGSGRLVFVTVRHVVATADGPALTEEQDLVYRGTAGEAVKPAGPGPRVDALVERVVQPDPLLLFRYSALTGNGHRIHYDADYVRGEEGYPGLVVHGPLQATWMAMAAAELALLQRFSFRGRRPAFAGHPLTVQAWHDAGALRLRTLDATGAACMTAEAE